MSISSQRSSLTAANLVSMGSRYYTHFIAESPAVAQAGEWSGIVELTRPLRRQAEELELSQVLAGSLDLEADAIRILNWSWLH